MSTIDIELFTKKSSINRSEMWRLTMGIVEKLGYEIAKLSDGKTSILKMSKELNTSIDNIKRSLNKLEDIDIIKMP